MSSYLWNAGWDRERERLDHVAAMLDPGTIRHLEAIGVREGWRCAEVGAGTGSIAEWLAARVGGVGHVVVTDIDTRFLERLTGPNLEVRRHDIAGQPLEAGGYDLIHERLVLAHLSRPETTLRDLASALRPGGWLLVEEYDMRTASAFDPASPLQARVAAAVNAVFEARGVDPYFGIKLLPALRSYGLQEVRAEGRLQVVPLGTELAEPLALKLEQLGDRLAQTGLLSGDDVQQAITAARAPGGVHYTPLMVAAWGRRP